MWCVGDVHTPMADSFQATVKPTIYFQGVFRVFVTLMENWEGIGAYREPR